MGRDGDGTLFLTSRYTSWSGVEGGAENHFGYSRICFQPFGEYGAAGVQLWTERYIFFLEGQQQQQQHMARGV